MYEAETLYRVLMTLYSTRTVYIIFVRGVRIIGILFVILHENAIEKNISQKKHIPILFDLKFADRLDTQSLETSV